MTTYGTLTFHHQGQQHPTWSIKAQPHVVIRIKRVLPRARATRSGHVIITDTLDAARDLDWIRERYPLDMDDRTAQVLTDRLKRWTERQQAVDDILGGHPGCALLTEPARTPRGYQLQFAAMLRATGRLLLADDVGLGKTFSSYLILAQPDALPALVVTLTHLPNQWMGELAATWPGFRGHLVTKGTPYDLRRTRGARGHYPDVIVMNYSKLAGWGDALAGQVRTVIFDEIQELRHGTATNKGVAAARVTADAKYACGLSATPVYNYGGEIWNIYNILAPDRLGTREEFLREWGASDFNGKLTVADPAALGTYLRDSGLLLRRTRKDVHRELPEPLRIRQEVSADPAAIDQLAGDVLQMARLILDSNAKQQQRWAAAGDLDWRMRQATGIAKAPYVAEWVRVLLESEDKVVLFGWHRAVYGVWEQRLAEFKPVLYTGSETPTQKQAAAEAFTNGPSRVLMMSLRAGAGLDGLQKACSVAVFGELDWSPGVHDQCIGRLARDGQESTVAAYFLVSDQGSDPVMDDVLQLKRMQAEPLRDPTAPLLAPAVANLDRVRMLAQAVVDRARITTGATA
ncbi:MAG: SNF2-related protein [Pseudonocardiaceae bacterium]